ncbi:MAG: rod shape-determining protein MreC [Pelagibacterales bacterium]|nr:rod shape-determining protein MreC [Pelagibacterales bacterium]
MRSFENNSFGFIKDNYLRTIVITIVLGAISLSLIYIDSSKRIYSDARSNIRDLILTVSSTIASPAILLNDGITTIIEINSLYSELDEYKKQQALSSNIFQELSVLRQQVEIYESDLNIIKDDDHDSIGAEIFTDSSNRYFSSVLIKAGSNDNLKENNAIVSSKGLLGRISEVGEEVSRGLLLTDISSRVPVSVSSNEIQGILIGQNLKKPRVYYLLNISSLNEGDLVTTSGKGGIFPSNIPIGTVSNKNQKNKYIEIDLFERINNLSHVRIINYKLEKEIK